MEDAA
jgi:hypothetical protein